MLGNLNLWVEDRTKVGITYGFSGARENCNRWRVADFCAERGLCVDNTHFEHKGLHKCTRVAKSQNGVEVIDMTNLVFVKKNMLPYVKDVRAVRERGRGISDHPVILVMAQGRLEKN